MGTTRYEIRVAGELSEMMLAAFPGMTADIRGRETLLAGELTDQAALYGVLERIESFNLALVEVRRSSGVVGESG